MKMKTKTVERLLNRLTPEINNKVDKIVEDMLTHKQAKEKVLTVAWKTQQCHQTDCWCLMIVPEHPIPYEHDGVELEIEFIVPSGTIDKMYAEHIVNLHNTFLETQYKDTKLTYNDVFIKGGKNKSTPGKYMQDEIFNVTEKQILTQ